MRTITKTIIAASTATLLLFGTASAEDEPDGSAARAAIQRPQQNVVRQQPAPAQHRAQPMPTITYPRQQPHQAVQPVAPAPAPTPAPAPRYDSAEDACNARATKPTHGNNCGN